ncbi:cytochrome P450 [Leifsonia kafniensis]|uniref:Cytochrome P450 n=1 Tax=Leifsonia kafniensis TaxID=475957 RepID=A0ABP7KRU8_9MICO
MPIPAPTLLEVSTDELAAWPPPPDTRKQPASYFNTLREEAGIYRFAEPHPNGRPIYLATSWKAVSHILSHIDEFDSNLSHVLPDMAALLNLPYPEVPTRYRPEGIAFTEGEDHDVKRAWANKLFTPERMASYPAVIAEVADRLIDGFIDAGTANMSDAFAEAIPLEVLTIIMGMPREDAADVKRWTDIVTRLSMTAPTAEEIARTEKALDESSDYVLEQCRMRLENPTDDYLSEVIHDQIARDGEFDQNAMVVHVRSMFLAAYHTTAAMVAALIVHLTQMPELQESLREDSGKFRKVIEESVRMEGPLQWHPRSCVKDTVVDGIEVPAGAIVFTSFGAGSHDPEKFENPYEFDAGRRNVMHHLSFGSGEHRCPGAPLARLYAQVGLERLLARTKNLVLDEEASDLTPLPGFNFRIPSRVVVTFDKA